MEFSAARLLPVFAAVLLGLVSACHGGDARDPVQPIEPRAPGPAAATGEIVVAGWNVANYLISDRYTNGRYVDAAMKPEEEILAVVRTIKEINPDILQVSEMGDAAVFAGFRERLADAGLAYPEFEHLQAADPSRHIALLSRFPIVSRNSQKDLSFELHGRKEYLQRGILDVTIQVNPSSRLRVLAAHLKSRRQVPQGEALLRRNEAHLLRQHIDAILAEDPAARLLLLGDFNDTKNEPAIQEIMGPRGSAGYMADILLTDPNGERWTHYWRTADEYSRIDYIMASPALLPDVDFKKSRIHAAPDWQTASDHRPVVATIRVSNKD